MLYIRSFIGRMNPVIQLIELITGRPQFYLSLLDFKLKYFFIRNINHLDRDYLLEDWFRTKKCASNFKRLTLLLVTLTVLIAIFYKSR
ncbi:hypothetical protein SQ03_19745 [Methylobacterium platani JCM 14648]|uniref:Uncharacterized protein n=3 Tax=Methylobacterium platani TaxID=427683 RepID=A0A179SKZ9_9HYPH|nr:hypothetical protein SQ03_19745 [Methylobacterium platani JCM 14648]OAS27194.1 hypothetical protein A5481_01830 [Methylobacterium platani]